MNSKTSFFFFLILIVTTGEAHERGKGSLQDVKQLSEAARKKISDLLIDKDEGGEGKERLLWEKNVTNYHKICLLHFANS